MDPLLIVLRVVHVVGGVFWGGAILFVVHFLEPAVRDAGPDGAKVMQALQKRRYLDVVPAVASRPGTGSTGASSGDGTPGPAPPAPSCGSAWAASPASPHSGSG
jgi:hypothetical protein